MYVLLDSNVTAGYYLPRSLHSTKAAQRIEAIFDSVRSGESKHFFYIPNFCIAEVFSVFMKHAFGGWNPQVQGKGKLDSRVYGSLVKQFQKDIHNGRFLYHYELNRYHILGINLVAPVDHHFRISRGKKRRVVPMGTFDHLIISMGIHLAHIHTPEQVCILTADDRLSDIARKCKGPIKAGTVKYLRLNMAEELTGRRFDAAIFPKCLNLKTAKKKELADTFGVWPPPIGKLGKVYRWTQT